MVSECNIGFELPYVRTYIHRYFHTHVHTNIRTFILSVPFFSYTATAKQSAH